MKNRCTCCCGDTELPLDDKGVCPECHGDSFMALLGAGEVNENEIGEFVSEWHRIYEGMNTNDEAFDSLPYFLGMTVDEYNSWVEQKKTPVQILADRG